MINPYKKILIHLFEEIIELKHSIFRVNGVLKNDVRKCSLKESEFISASSLIISDWTEPTNNGWEINFHTGVSKLTTKENYEIEIKKIISRECCLTFAQSFERMESFFKDCVYLKIKRDQDYRNLNICKSIDSRENLPGGEKLFELIKKACGNQYGIFSNTNNANFRFKEMWKVFSEVRHSITHSQSIIRSQKVNKSNYHFEIFEYLFYYEELTDEKLQLILDFQKLAELIKYLSELSYQIFKAISLNEKLNYKI